MRQPARIDALDADALDDPGSVPVERRPFGTLRDGTVVGAVTLSAAYGVSARIITLGATLQALVARDRGGRLADVTRGYDDAERYADRPVSRGQTVGRYANRIANGRFVLDGDICQLATNDGANALHGGPPGFGVRLWRIADVSRAEGRSSVSLALTSAAGGQGFNSTPKPRRARRAVSIGWVTASRRSRSCSRIRPIIPPSARRASRRTSPIPTA